MGKVENVNINEGQDAEFVCKFLSYPKPLAIKWFKTETEEVLANENIIITNTDDSSILKLINCKLIDSGSFYIAKVANQLGECVSNKATLNVSSGPAFFTGPDNAKVLKDKEAKFECVVKSNPKPNVAWFFSGKEFTARDGVRIEKDQNKDKYSLIIPKVTPAHIGTITVKATNEFGTTEKTCELDVLEGPKLSNKLENLTVNEGEQAKFSVKVGGKPKPFVKWFKDDVEIVIDESIETIETEEEFSFIIKSTKSHENSGTYSAKVINEFGEVVSNKATLTVNRAPKFLTKPENTVGIQDQAIRFECLIDALPKPKLAWLLNGKELTNKDNIKFETDAKSGSNALVIPKIMASHMGTYTIKASNSVGEVEHTFDLNTLDVPKITGKLENTTVTEGQEARFTVKFTGRPKPTFKWFLEEEEIITTVDYEIIETDDSITLIIKSAKPQNAGNYWVQLTNDAGKLNSNKALLTVNRGPVFIKVPELLGPTNKDESVRFECVVEGLPLPTINWFVFFHLVFKLLVFILDLTNHLIIGLSMVKS